MDFGAAIPIPTAWELGRRWYRDRLSFDWQPKDPETMRTIFDAVGLTGEFWRVP